MVTGSKELIRDINSHLVLEKILNEGPISRASIASALGLTKATVSAIVSDLINRKLVREIGSDDTSLGRKPILLEFCSQNGYIVSIDLGVDAIFVLTSSLTGRNCGLKQYPNTYSSDTVIDGLINIIDDTIQSVGDSEFGVVGICIGINGVVKDNKIAFTTYYDYASVPIAESIEAHFKIPVILENEANLSAVGEKTFCYHVPNLIDLSVHSGIGVGIIINDSLYTGMNGNAGEFGHTIVKADGIPCPCGNCGCLEQYASERAILSSYCSKTGQDSIEIDEFIALYSKGDPLAHTLIDQFTKYMGVAINNLLTTLNPNVIVINSNFTYQIPTLVGDIKGQLKNRMDSFCNLVPSGLQDLSILLGGVCLCIHGFLGVNYISPDSSNLK